MLAQPPNQVGPGGPGGPGVPIPPTTPAPALVGQAPQPPILSWGTIRMLLFLTAVTMIWVVFLLDLLVTQLLADTPLGQSLVERLPASTLGKSILLIVFTLIVFVAYGMGRHGFEGTENSHRLLNRISNMAGMNPFYAGIATLCTVMVLVSSYDGVPDFSLQALGLLAAVALGLAAVPPSHSPVRTARRLLWYLRHFFSQVPLINRWVRDTPRPNDPGEPNVDGTFAPREGTPVMRGTPPPARPSHHGGSPPVTPVTPTRPAQPVAQATPPADAAPATPQESTPILPT